MAKKVPAKPPAKRKPRAKKPTVPSLAEYYAEMQRLQAKIDAEEIPAPPKPPRPQNVPDCIEFGQITAADLEQAASSLKRPLSLKPIAWRSWLVGGAKAAALVVVGAVVGVYAAGGIEVGPGPKKPDVISAVFDEQESALRELSGERAKALRAGTIKSEAESVAWMQSRFLPRVEASWAKLLTAEAAEFGGKKWTAEKEAATIERYVR